MARVVLNFSWLRIDIEYEYHLLLEHYRVSVESLPHAEMLSQIEINKIFNKMNITSQEEYDQEIAILYQEHEQKFGNFFPNRINYSFIVTLYSFIESSTNKLFDDYSKWKKLPFALDGFEGDLGTKISRFLLCFKKEMKFDIGIQTIKEIALVRNNIVHQNGYVGGDDNKLKRFITANRRLQVKLTDNILTIGNSFCDEYARKVESLFKILFENLGYKR